MRLLLNWFLRTFLGISDEVEFLQGERIILRPGEDRDIDRMLVWYNDSELNRLAGWGENKASRSSIVYNISKSFGSDPINLIIEVKNGESIGTIQLYSVDHFNKSCSLGIRIGEREYWNRGYGREAIMEILNYAFTDLKLNRVSLKVYTYNERAILCYRKCGFTQEGILRKSALVDNVYYDEIVMSMLKDDFQRIRGEKR